MRITTYGNPDAPFLLIQMVDAQELEGLEGEAAEIRRRTEADFGLMALEVSDWNAELSPWPAPAVFGKEDFGDGAAAALERVLECCQTRDKVCVLGGYSLAGLFALWAGCQTEAFQGVAAASPSLWFPGFLDYMREHPIHARCVYLSLGDREERTRNPVMAAVGDRVREAHALLRDRGVPTTLEWNQGNHFKDPGLRTAKAFAWVLERLRAPRDPE